MRPRASKGSPHEMNERVLTFHSTSKFASRRAKKGFGRKMERHFSRNGAPTVLMMTVVTIFNDFEYNVPQQSTNNWQKLRERMRFASRHAVTFWHSGRQK